MKQRSPERRTRPGAGQRGPGGARAGRTPLRVPRPRAGDARDIALRILLRVSEEGAWASRLLEAIDEEGTDPRDLALIHEIVLGVLRWRANLDDRIDRLLRRRIESLEPAVRETLRLGAYQILFLDRVPGHAAVNSSVELARRFSSRGAAALVNAVLRRLSASRDAATPGTPSGQTDGALPPPASGSRESPDPPRARSAEVRADAPPRPPSAAKDATPNLPPPASAPQQSPDSPRPRSAAARRRARARRGPPSRSPEPLARRLARDLSHPEWMVERAVERFGEEGARSWLLANNQPAPITLRPNPLHPAHETLAARLHEEGVQTSPGVLAPASLRVLQGKPARTRLFAEGAFWIQDEASQIVPLLFPPPWDGLSADLCAAPGGKSFVLATGPTGHEPCGPSSPTAAPPHSPRGPAEGPSPPVAGEPAHSAWPPSSMATRGSQSPPPAARTPSGPARVVSFDLHVHRLRRLLEGERRIAPGRIAAVAGDLAAAPPALWGIFDRVLVDAPCSGTGILRRHPEIRWRLAPAHLAELSDLQSRLLDAAFRLLRPGGFLVYSVCSVEPEEGDHVLDAFLARSGARLLDPRPHLHESARSAIDGEGRLRTYPHIHGCDAFYAALVQKP